MSIRVVPDDLTSREAAELIAELNAELAAVYPEEGANHFRLDPTEVGPGRGAFLLAFRGDELVGCGAVRRLDENDAEVKRMYVRKPARGQGIGRVLLNALEVEARNLGVRRMVLETGTRQTEAVALYRRSGFVDIPLWGEYLSSPEASLCMAKELR